MNISILTILRLLERIYIFVLINTIKANYLYIIYNELLKIKISQVFIEFCFIILCKLYMKYVTHFAFFKY